MPMLLFVALLATAPASSPLQPAGRSVLAHLIDLQTRGAVRNDNDEWMLA